MNKEMTSLKSVYGLAIGIFLVLLVSLGIAAFYKEASSFYYHTNEGHFRDILLIAFPSGLVFSVLGLVLPTKADFLRLGLLFGGVLTMLYAVVYPGTSGLSLGWIFGAVVIGLMVLIPLGYYRFVMKNNRNIGSEKGKNGES